MKNLDRQISPLVYVHAIWKEFGFNVSHLMINHRNDQLKDFNEYVWIKLWFNLTKNKGDLF